MSEAVNIFPREVFFLSDVNSEVESGSVLKFTYGKFMTAKLSECRQELKKELRSIIVNTTDELAALQLKYKVYNEIQDN